MLYLYNYIFFELGDKIQKYTDTKFKYCIRGLPMIHAGLQYPLHSPDLTLWFIVCLYKDEEL